MKKIDIFQLISDLKRNASASERGRLDLLEAFMALPAIKNQKDNADIPFHAFKEYAISQSETVTPAFFSAIEKWEEPFKKFVISSPGDFDLLPRELHGSILSELGDSAAAQLSRTSSTLYYKVKSPEIWRGKMIGFGCPPALFDELVSLNVVTDYHHLYRAFRQAIRTNKDYFSVPAFRIKDLELLLLLSGEDAAVEKAVSLSKPRIGYLDLRYLDPMHYLIHSGKPSAINLAMNRGVKFNPSSDFLIDAAKTGLVPMLEYMIGMTGIMAQEASCMAIHQPTLLGAAFLSGHTRMVDFVLSFYEKLNLNAKEENRDGGFFFYSIQSGDLSAVTRAFELGSKGYILKISDWHKNALELAAWSGSIEVFNLILSRSLRLNINPAHQSRLLLHAVLSGNKAMVEHVLDYCNQNHINQEVERRNSEYCNGNLVHLAFASARDVAFVAYIIELSKKLNINLHDSNYLGENILHCAVKSENPAMITFARQVCADLQLPFTPETQDNAGHDALYAVRGKSMLIDALTMPLTSHRPLV